MKRLITVILTLILTANIAYAADIQKMRYEEKSNPYQLILDLGIISDEESEDHEEDALTRGQFVKLAYRLKNYEDKDSIPSASTAYFNDIDVYHYAAGYIQYLVGTGVVKGYENSSFRPEQNITPDEAARILLRCAGYGIYEDGGRSLGAQISQIKKGITGEVNYYDAAEMIYRLLFTDTMKFSIEDGKSSYVEGDLVLRELLELDYRDGVIEEIGGCGLYQKSDKENSLTVDGIQFDTEKTLDPEYCGMYGRVFYHKDQTALAVQPLKNEVLTIDAKDIARAEDQRLYYDDGSKEKSLRLSAEIDILYNGYPVGSLSDYLPKRGSIRAIDRNADSVFDVISIVEYNSYLVKAAGVNSEEISFKSADNKTLSLKDFDTVEIQDESGKKLTLASLSENTVLMVYSYQKEYIRLVAVNNTLQAEIKSIGTNDDEEKVIRTEGAEFILNENYYRVNEPSIGETVTLYLDSDNYVVGILSASAAAEWKTGFVIFARLAEDDDGEERILFKLVNESGEVVKLFCEDKVTVDGDKMITSEAYDAICVAYHQFADKLTIGESESENVSTRLIRYYQNGDRIKKVDTPIIHSMFDKTRIANTTTGNQLILSAKGNLYNPENTTGFRVVYGSNLPGEIRFKENALIFTVPEETNTSPEDDDYGVMPASQFRYASGKFFDVSGYTFDANGLMSEYAVVRKNQGAGSDLSTLMVKSQTEALNENDEVVTMIETTGGTKYEISDKDNDIDPATVQKGDVISYELANGKVIIRKLLYRIGGGGELNKQPYYTSEGGEYHFNVPFRAMLGTVGKIDGSYLQIGFGGVRDDELVALSQNVEICDLTKGSVKIYQGVRSDVNPGDSIIITSRKGALQQLVIIKK